MDLHVQTDPAMPLHDAHILSGRVKTAIREAVPEVLGVLIHMNPTKGSRAVVLLAPPVTFRCSQIVSIKTNT